MHKLNSYIGKTVFTTGIGALVVLTFLLFISILVSQLGDIKGEYTFNHALWYSLWQLPNAVYENITFAAFLGCVIGLGVHASANELLIFRCAGVSALRVVWAALRPVLLLTFFGVLLGEFVTPKTLQMAESVKASAQSRSAVPISEKGNWYLEGNTFMYFSGLNTRLYGITQYVFDEERLQLRRSSFAEQAVFDNSRWTMQNEKAAVFIREDKQNNNRQDANPNQQIEQQIEAEKLWQTEIEPALLNDLVLPAEALSIRSLLRSAISLDKQGLESQTFWLAFWQKVAQPFVVISLALVGIAFIFGSLRESTMGFRLTVSILIGILFNLMQQFLANSSLVFNFPPLVAVVSPILLCALFGFYLLRSR